MKPIAVFYHAYFCTPHAKRVTKECMDALRNSGLEQESQEIYCSYNTSLSEAEMGDTLSLFPKKAQLKSHGPDSFSENLTIDQLHTWAQSHPGWDILYFHSKGASHTPGCDSEIRRGRWRACMLDNLILNWRDCVQDLRNGAEMVTCHWLVGQADGTQNIPGGNFLWVVSEYVASLPSIRLRIHGRGIGSLAARYEAEVFWGFGPRLPRVVDKHPAHPGVH